MKILHFFLYHRMYFSLIMKQIALVRWVTNYCDVCKRHCTVVTRGLTRNPEHKCIHSSDYNLWLLLLKWHSNKWYKNQTAQFLQKRSSDITSTRAHRRGTCYFSGNYLWFKPIVGHSYWLSRSLCNQENKTPQLPVQPILCWWKLVRFRIEVGNGTSKVNLTRRLTIKKVAIKTRAKSDSGDPQNKDWLQSIYKRWYSL